MFRTKSYTAADRKIQSPTGTILGAIMIAGVGLAGCGGVSVPLGSADVETPMILTGSIPSDSDVAFSDIDERDRQILALTLDSATIDAANQVQSDETLAWSNPESGNSGTISDVDLAAFEDTGCLAFNTTANTIAGIKIYRGTACRDISTRLVITALAVNSA